MEESGDATELLPVERLSSVNECPDEFKDKRKIFREKPGGISTSLSRKLYVPRDRFWLAVIIFVIQGFGTLYPWNTFITADEYFLDYKFANVSMSVDYRANFMLYIGYGNFVPYLIFLLFSLYIPARKSRFWCFCGLTVMFLCYVLTTLLAVYDTSQCPELFFIITMATIVVFNAASAVYQSGMYALAAKLPERYIQSYIVGQTLGGTCVAVASIIAIACMGGLRVTAIGYFTSAVWVLFFSMLTYWLLYKLKMMKYYLELARETAAAEAVLKAIASPSHNTLTRLCSSSRTMCAIFMDIKMQAFNIWLTSFVSLSVYPLVLAEIAPVGDPGPPSEFLDLYFVPLVCYLTFNLGDFLGSVFPACLRWRFPNCTWLLVVVRLVFFPLLIICNYRADQRTVPIYIDNDIAYACIVAALALSNGYLKTVIMMDGPQTVRNPDWASKAASLMLFFLVLGVFCGLHFSHFFFPWIVNYDF